MQRMFIISWNVAWMQGISRQSIPGRDFLVCSILGGSLWITGGRDTPTHYSHQRPLKPGAT